MSGSRRGVGWEMGANTSAASDAADFGMKGVFRDSLRALAGLVWVLDGRD